MLHELFIGTLRRNTDARLETGADAITVLRGVVDDVFKLLHDYPGYVRAFFEHFRELDPEQRAEIAVKRDEYVALVTGVIRKAMAEGSVRKADPTLTAHCLFGICNWAYQWYRPHKDPAPEVLAGEVLGHLQQRTEAALKTRVPQAAPASCASRHAASASGLTSRPTS